MVQKVPPPNADSDKILQTVVRRLGALVVEILISLPFPELATGWLCCDHFFIATCTRCKRENYMS